MSGSIDRAADVIYRTLSGKYGDFGHHEDTAQSLAAAGLLMPDLPEPTIWEQGKHPQWGNSPYSTRVVSHPSGGLMVRNPYMEWATPQQAREEALALLAAANYAEENQ